MKVLRTVSTRRLLAGVAGLLVVAGSGTAIAVGAASSGPVPGPKPLARALHDALAAPAPAGITANISFTNHLIDASALQGSDPLLSGATGRLWLSGRDHLRLELQSDKGDAQIVVNGSSFFISDPSMKTVYEGTLPAQSANSDGKSSEQLPTLARIQSLLNDLIRHANVSGAQPSDVAGHAAYTVKVSPAHDGGLLGAAKLAWDAATGVPLRFAVYASNSSTPVLELKATGITYGAVPASVFAISPPSDSKVIKVNTAGDGGKSDHAKKHGRAVTGVAAVAAKLPFTLNAPSQLVGLPRRSVTLLSWGHKPAALITYGQNLGGMAVIEQLPAAARPSTSTSPKSRDGGSRLNLPTVSINGVTGQELDTALGTLVRFTRGGVAYTVVGSVPAAAADAAARAL